MHEKQNSSANNYYSVHEKQNSMQYVLDLQCTKNKTAVKDNESLFMDLYTCTGIIIYNYTAIIIGFFKWRYFNTNTFKVIPCTSCMHACVILSSETRAVIIVITEAAIFKLEVLSASSSEVCLLCFCPFIVSGYSPVDNSSRVVILHILLK